MSSNSISSIAANRSTLGYRVVSLSMANNSASIIWLKDLAPAELGLFMNHETMKSKTAALDARGYRVACLSVSGAAPSEYYHVSYVRDGSQSAVVVRLTESELADLPLSFPDYRVGWFARSGVGTETRYAAVLIRDGLLGKLHIGLTKAELGDKITSYRDAGYRPVCVLGTTGPAGMSYAANWVSCPKAMRWIHEFDVSLPNISAATAQQLRPEVICRYLAEDQSTVLYSIGYVEDLQPVWTITGNTDPGLEEFDRLMTNAMSIGKATRASIAVAKDGRLMLSRGYTRHPVTVPSTQPTNLFRLASISKSITAVTVMGLVEAGRLNLDDKLGNFMDLSDVKDKRWTNITIRHLLQHLGGWNRETSFDPAFYDAQISTSLKVPLPITRDHVITYMKRQPLQMAPGTRFAYSNFGYLLLGRVIERVTGRDYETFVRQNVLEPLGIYSARLGRTARVDHLPGEVEYEEGGTTAASVLSPARPIVSTPYGAFNMETWDSDGGWVFSAEDLVRFGSFFTDTTDSALLSKETIETMWARPSFIELPVSVWYKYYACGWVVFGTNGGLGIDVGHSGSMQGTSTLLVRQSDGYCWAALFNTMNENGTLPILALGWTTNITAAAARVKQWPATDLFDTDADGLPDTFERANFGSLTASDGTRDTDGDGLSDTAEWVAMSSPVEREGVFHLEVRAGKDGLRWLESDTRVGRAYSLRVSGNIIQNWATAKELNRFHGDGFPRNFQIDPAEPSGFYRVTVSRRGK